MKGLSDGDPNGMRSSKFIRDLKDNFKLLIGMIGRWLQCEKASFFEQTGSTSRSVEGR
jgi:hypothetical protein